MNDVTTEAAVRRALLAGFDGIDTANHYRNHAGVRRGIAAARRMGHTRSVWLQTKIEGCGNSVDSRSPVLRGSCHRDTLSVFQASLRELGVSQVDLTLLHSPPCVPGAPWVHGRDDGTTPGQCIGHPAQDLVYPERMDCTAEEPCRMMQQQWRALEEMYHRNFTLSIGVSNYCSACLACLERTARVRPHVNQIELHAGMGSSDPRGLASNTLAYGAHVQAYRPLAHGETSLLHDAVVSTIARAHGKTNAQIALRYVLQLGHALVTSTENAAHMRSDVDIFDWSLSPTEMATLTRLNTSPGDPTIMCVL